MMTLTLTGLVLLCAWALRKAERRRRELAEDIAEIRKQAERGNY